jgi:hypothetical protein
MLRLRIENCHLRSAHSGNSDMATIKNAIAMPKFFAWLAAPALLPHSSD